MIHEFRLTSRGIGGVFCDEGGAFVGAVPLLARTRSNGKDEWRPRDCDELSKDMSAQYGLPVDMSSKRGGLAAIAKALNEGDVARAQVATVLLGIPNPPSLSKRAPSRQEEIALARDLQWSGLLKADWDSDKHPRWPAGAPDSQGGQFAPKGDDPAAGQSAGGAALPQKPPPDRRDIAISAYPQRHGLGAPSNNQSAPPNNNAGDDGSRNVPDAAGRGVDARSGHHTSGVQVADGSIALGGLGIIEASAADWASVARLANGALRLGSGLIIAAPALLDAMDALRERASVLDAIGKFELDPTNAADVLAARAYVWAKNELFWAYPDVPSGGPQRESVAQSIMALELARPGTAGLASQEDKQSRRYLDDQKRAHHLIPANVWEQRLDIATLASQAGWQPDSEENLIALPADQATQARLVAEGGLLLPIHSSNHRAYDFETLGEIIKAKENYGERTLTPAEARAIFETVALRMRGRILAGEWMPKLR